MFKEDFSYGARDIRFTTQGKTLYAIALGWPEDGKLVIRSLAKSSDGKNNRIKRIELLGYHGQIKFVQTATGLEVSLPAGQAANTTCSLKVIGSNFIPAVSGAN
jgi:alpha-L-fucosidase